MAVTLSTAIKNINEDLSQFISQVSAKATPVTSDIGKTKARQNYHETLTDKLRAPNKDNIRTEGADALVPSNNLAARIGNYTQQLAGEVSVSGRVEAIDIAGAKSEFSRQLANVTMELKTDWEATVVSNNPSVAGASSASAGMGAWIKTNAVENGATPSTTPGFSNGIVAAPTAATGPTVVTEQNVKDMAQKIYESGGQVDDCTVIASTTMKTKLSAILSGNSTRWNNAKDRGAYANVDFYDTDFGQFKIKPHRMLTVDTIIAYDPSYWATATLRPWKLTELAVTGDARKVQMLGEFTLEAKNEASSGKIAGVKIA